MKAQKKIIFLNKKRGLKYALCIITLMCCLLNTVVQSTDIELNSNNVTRYVLFNYATYQAETLTNQAVNGYVINNGEGYNTNYRTTYTTLLGKMYLTFTKVKIDNVIINIKAHVEFDGGVIGLPIITQYNTYSVGTKSVNPYEPSIRFKRSSASTWNSYYISQSEVNTEKNTVNSSFNNGYIKIYRDAYINYHAEFTNINDTEYEQIEITLPYTYISSTLIIDKIEIIINSEEYKIIQKWEDKQQELEEAIQDIEVTIDQNAIDNIINNPPTIDGTLNVGVFNFTNETIPLYIMSLTLSLAIISFLLYGKK